MEVVATAPVRVADAGGWTDTWFARHGQVCNLAVTPGATVRAALRPAADGTIELAVVAFGERYAYPAAEPPGRHPLLEAAIARHAPVGSLTVSVEAGVPPGSGVGTSAAVTVALIGALLVLGGRDAGPDAVARAAHQVETVDLRQQSGVQDQLAAAHGGALLITITAFAEATVFPDATVAHLPLSPTTWDALGRRLLTVSLGQPHRSSEVHTEVIAGLVRDPSRRDRLEPLRRAAADAAAALVAGDLDAYGAALRANTTAQAGLHPALVSPAAHRLFDLAGRHRAVGWKVNGAGGDGGSVTLVTGDDAAGAADLRRALTGAGWPILALSPGAAGLGVAQVD